MADFAFFESKVRCSLELEVSRASLRLMFTERGCRLSCCSGRYTERWAVSMTGSTRDVREALERCVAIFCSEWAGVDFFWAAWAYVAASRRLRASFSGGGATEKV